MITRREFLTYSAAAVAGTAVLSSGLATPALANHKNGGVAQAKTRETMKDGSDAGTPDGHPQNHGEISQRTEGTPAMGGALRTPENRGKHASGHDGDCPNGTGECPNGSGECDGSGLVD